MRLAQHDCTIAKAKLTRQHSVYHLGGRYTRSKVSYGTARSPACRNVSIHGTYTSTPPGPEVFSTPCRCTQHSQRSQIGKGMTNITMECFVSFPLLQPRILHGSITKTSRIPRESSVPHWIYKMRDEPIGRRTRRRQ